MPLTQSDIKEIYSLPETTNSVTLSDSSASKTAEVDIVNLNNESILIIPIKRTYFNSLGLVGAKQGKNGKVVKHEFFILKPQYKGNGIGRTIGIQEYAKYKNRGIEQIILLAAWDGITVWPHNKFIFINKMHENEVLRFLRDWLLDEKKANIKTVERLKLNSLSVFKPSFFRNKKGKNFNEWLIEKIKNRAYPMYKDIE